VVYSEGNNSLYRLHVDSREREQLYAPFPTRANRFGGSALPGSLLQYIGSGFAPDMRLAVEGVHFPLLESEPSSFKVQVPWDFTLDSAPINSVQLSSGLSITRPGSPFLLRSPFVLDTLPQPRLVTQFDPNGNNSVDVAALFQDFSGFVSQASPAPAGSTIHMYLTGLGPLDRPLKTLEPGPSDPPARPLAAIACYIRDRDFQSPARGLVLPFVAYAPGLVGVYQVDATIPEDWPAGQQTISCANADRQGTSARLWTTR
jgi:uncharacterized protein (TIGR03437 family)